ncbi:UvrD-helicase domain-containing protein [Hydrogenophaga sp. 5NK40-0174]|uniref:UvrD-helicase domain-containing protein n=1 Tax=Hydrogenophaga sp. 5NK40-0174 TaxID=3127649 RepID=UPI003108D008
MKESLAYHVNGRLSSPSDFYAIACDPSRSVAVEACAGAGKTWMLVSRMLRALLEGCPPQDILAITFTRKAAGEMRERLQDWLATFSEAELEKCESELRSRGLDADQARKLAPALKGLRAKVQTTGRAVQVRTFHSWFAALLKAAPLSLLHDLSLPADYELLEDEAPAVAVAMRRFMVRVASDPELKQAFDDSVMTFGRSATLDALAKTLSKRVEFALADREGVVQRSVGTFAERFPALAGLTEPEQALMGDACRERWLARARILGAEKNKTPQTAANQIVDAFELPDEAGYMSQRLAMLRSAVMVATEDRITKNLEKFDAALEAEAELQPILAAVRQHAAWRHQQRMMTLARSLIDIYAQVKRDHGWVDMSDVELAASRLLTDPELSGWLQQRLDAQVRHLLIDEFQDTNPLQWQTLYGWLSGYAGAGAGQQAPSVFLVGDPKQSIYRFRRAEPQVFLAAQRFVVEALEGAVLSCDHTRRCASGVVATLNSVMAQAELDTGYQGFRAHTTGSESEGEVLCFAPLEAEKGDAHQDEGEADDSHSHGQEWRDSLNVPRREVEASVAALEGERVAKWIHQRMVIEGRPPESFMVLSRRRSRLAGVDAALRALHIPSEQPEKNGLADLPAAQDVLALLDALVSPGHDLSLARALRSPLFGWDDSALTALALRVQSPSGNSFEPATSEKVRWWAALQRWSRSEGAPAWAVDSARRLQRYQQWAQALPPHDVLSLIFSDSDVYAAYARRSEAATVPAIHAQLQAMLGEALAFEGGRYLSVYRFVHQMRQTNPTMSSTAQTGAVRLLTIHGAKGLEAHTVVLMDTDAAPPRANTMDVLVDWPGESPHPVQLVFLASEKHPPVCSEDLLATEQQARGLEELNALYVALTRAEERLVISSVQSRRKSATVPSWYARLAPHGEPAELVDDTPMRAVGEDGQVAKEKLENEKDPHRHLLWALPDLTAVVEAEAALMSAEETGKASQSDGTAEAAERERTAAMGQALHRALQWVPTPSKGFEWDERHWTAVRREFGVQPADMPHVRQMAAAMIGGEAAWAWDDQAVDFAANEMELRDAGAVVRLDRLVKRRGTNEWWVLDYKSALRPESSESLRGQLNRYRVLVQVAKPGAAVRAGFVNAKGRLIELTDSGGEEAMAGRKEKGDEP